MMTFIDVTRHSHRRGDKRRPAALYPRASRTNIMHTAPNSGPAASATKAAWNEPGVLEHDADHHRHEDACPSARWRWRDPWPNPRARRRRPRSPWRPIAACRRKPQQPRSRTRPRPYSRSARRERRSRTGASTPSAGRLFLRRPPSEDGSLSLRQITESLRNAACKPGGGGSRVRHGDRGRGAGGDCTAPPFSLPRLRGRVGVGAFLFWGGALKLLGVRASDHAHPRSRTSAPRITGRFQEGVPPHCVKVGLVLLVIHTTRPKRESRRGAVLISDFVR